MGDILNKTTTISNAVISVEMKKFEVEVSDGKISPTFYLIIRNIGHEQIRLKVPLTSYFEKRYGQIKGQTRWHAGQTNASKGVTLPPGAFCEMGLVFSWAHNYNFGIMQNGDQLHVNVILPKPLKNICAIFEMTNFIIGASGTGGYSSLSDYKPFGTFILVSLDSEQEVEAIDVVPRAPAMTKLVKRIELLEASLADVLGRLDRLQHGRPDTARSLQSSTKTLQEVLAWLGTQDRVAVADLRDRLLPFDLLTGAVINQINERALDLVGEIAVEEVGNEVLVTREVFKKVLTNWE